MRFTDRYDAGIRLAEAIRDKYGGRDGVVYALPRGGVVLGAQVAKQLGMPLDVIVARKVGHPLNPEYAVGAVTETGEPVRNPAEVEQVGVPWFEREVEQQRSEARRRRRLYTDGRPPVRATGKTAIVVDDGIATGLTMLAAIQDVRQQDPERVVVAIPVIPSDAASTLARHVDDIVALEMPQTYVGAVSSYYDRFPQVQDDEVMSLLRSAPQSAKTDANESRVEIPVAGKLMLTGDLVLPPDPRGIVLFAHGSGSGRASPRNVFVARELQRAGLATLLFDLLTETEDADHRNRFNISLLTRRLLLATEWVKRQAATEHLMLGYFGASTGAAAALKAAAADPAGVRAVVSRGGRPDLADPDLPRVHAPVLLIVGENDPLVIDLNWEAYAQLGAVKSLVIVPGATHLFTEPGTLEQAAALAQDWFLRYLAMNRQLELDGVNPDLRPDSDYVRPRP